MITLFSLGTMPEYTTSTWVAIGVMCIQGFVATLLHSIGLYLLLTAPNKSIMVWILAHLSFVEVGGILYSSVNSIMRLFFNSNVAYREQYHMAMVIFFYSAIFLTVMIITLERVIAVKLTIKYRSVANKRRLIYVFICVWIISVTMSLVVAFSTKPVFNILLAVWEILVVILTICSYTYIAITVKRRRKRLRLNAQNTPIPPQRLKLTVPFLIVLTVICFYLIPDMLLAVGVEFSIWFKPIFYLNYVTDALIYIFGLSQFRNRVKKFCCGNQIRRSRTDMMDLSVVPSKATLSI